jgi:RimJ/RimL family protein N-acetyltransferase
MTIYAQTERLTLRALRHGELARLVQLLGTWDVVRWLSVVPFPYTKRDAEDFFADISPHTASATPHFYSLALKSDDLLIGGIGLHPPRTANPREGEIEIGYWLGQAYWHRGLMAEAARTVVDLAFAREGITTIGATTDPKNVASQKVLVKAGLRNHGIMPRSYPALRGGDEIVSWRLTRAEYVQELMAGAA